MERRPCTDRYLFDAARLPDGFRFPTAYLELIAGAARLPDLCPWWFLAESRELAEFWLTTLQQQYPSRELIPIAKRDDLSDTLACFDGADHSGNPVVHHIHAYTEPDWEQRGTWRDFHDWMAQAELDAAEYGAAEAED